MGHVLKETEGVGIGQRAVFGPVLDVVAPLHLMQAYDGFLDLIEINGRAVP
jgi:hypothetical protein